MISGGWGQGGENYLLAMLQRSPAALAQIAKTFSEPGTSEARFTLDGSTPASVLEGVGAADRPALGEHAMDVGVLCKACQTLFGNEAAIAQHQRACPALVAAAGDPGPSATPPPDPP